MPFPTPSMFPRLLLEFSAHWTALDALLPPLEPLVVLENLPLSTLRSLGAQLAAAEEQCGPRNLAVQLAREAAQASKVPLRRMTRDFNVWMRGTYSRRVESQLLALVVGPGVAAEKVRDMARTTRQLWQRIAALPPEERRLAPVLATGATLASFEAALGEFEAAQEAVIEAELEETLALAEAVVLREEIVAVATAYGHAVKGRLREGDPRRAALPELWHPGGREPEMQRPA